MTSVLEDLCHAEEIMQSDAMFMSNVALRMRIADITCGEAKSKATPCRTSGSERNGQVNTPNSCKITALGTEGESATFLATEATEGCTHCRFPRHIKRSRWLDDRFTCSCDVDFSLETSRMWLESGDPKIPRPTSEHAEGGLHMAYKDRSYNNGINASDPISRSYSPGTDNALGYPAIVNRGRSTQKPTSVVGDRRVQCGITQHDGSVEPHKLSLGLTGNMNNSASDTAGVGNQQHNCGGHLVGGLEQSNMQLDDQNVENDSRNQSGKEDKSTYADNAFVRNCSSEPPYEMVGNREMSCLAKKLKSISCNIEAPRQTTRKKSLMQHPICRERMCCFPRNDCVLCNSSFRWCALSLRCRRPQVVNKDSHRLHSSYLCNNHHRGVCRNKFNLRRVAVRRKDKSCVKQPSNCAKQPSNKCKFSVPQCCYGISTPRLCAAFMKPSCPLQCSCRPITCNSLKTRPNYSCFATVPILSTPHTNDCPTYSTFVTKSTPHRLSRFRYHGGCWPKLENKASFDAAKDYHTNHHACNNNCVVPMRGHTYCSPKRLFKRPLTARVKHKSNHMMLDTKSHDYQGTKKVKIAPKRSAFDESSTKPEVIQEPRGVSLSEPQISFSKEEHSQSKQSKEKVCVASPLGVVCASTHHNLLADDKAVMGLEMKDLPRPQLLTAPWIYSRCPVTSTTWHPAFSSPTEGNEQKHLLGTSLFSSSANKGSHTLRANLNQFVSQTYRHTGQHLKNTCKVVTIENKVPCTAINPELCHTGMEMSYTNKEVVSKDTDTFAKDTGTCDIKSQICEHTGQGKLVYCANMFTNNSYHKTTQTKNHHQAFNQDQNHHQTFHQNQNDPQASNQNQNPQQPSYQHQQHQHINNNSCNSCMGDENHPRPLNGRVVKVEGDGRCLFRSLITGQYVPLQHADRDDFGRPLKRDLAETETTQADRLREQVVVLMRDNLHFYSQLERGVINADQPIPSSYQRFPDRLRDMSLPTTMPGDLELNALALVLERQILVLGTDLKIITTYGRDRFPQSIPLAVRYTRLGPDVGHYDAVILNNNGPQHRNTTSTTTPTNIGSSVDGNDHSCSSNSSNKAGRIKGAGAYCSTQQPTTRACGAGDTTLNAKKEFFYLRDTDKSLHSEGLQPVTNKMAAKPLPQAAAATAINSSTINSQRSVEQGAAVDSVKGSPNARKTADKSTSTSETDVMWSPINSVKPKSERAHNNCAKCGNWRNCRHRSKRVQAKGVQKQRKEAGVENKSKSKKNGRPRHNEASHYKSAILSGKGRTHGKLSNKAAVGNVKHNPRYNRGGCRNTNRNSRACRYNNPGGKHKEIALYRKRAMKLKRKNKAVDKSFNSSSSHGANGESTETYISLCAPSGRKVTSTSASRSGRSLAVEKHRNAARLRGSPGKGDTRLPTSVSPQREPFNIIRPPGLLPFQSPPKLPEALEPASLRCLLCDAKLETTARDTFQCCICGRMAHRACVGNYLPEGDHGWGDQNYFMCSNCLPL